MSLTIRYEQPEISLPSDALVYRATNGGEDFTQIPYNEAIFDYFSDNAKVDDAFYISAGRYKPLPAGITLTVEKAISAGSYTLVWEYYKQDEGWVAIEDIVDNTESLSKTGSNTILFPQQWRPYQLIIEGCPSSHFWIRCRIEALEDWTEGGSNFKNVIKYGIGRLYVSGTTEEDPATFQDIFDWIQENQSHISVSKPKDDTFDFTKVGIVARSPVESHNEVIFMGQDVETNNLHGYNDIYLLTGTKLDDVTGYGGSTFIIYGTNNNSVFNVQSGSKIYGATFRTGKNNSDSYRYAGYCDFNGEWIDCNVELSMCVPYSGDVVNNCRITASLLIAGSMEGIFNNIMYLCTSSSLFYVYREGFTMTGFGYKFRSTGATRLFFIYQGSDRASQEWVLINPSVPLNQLDAYPTPIDMNIKGSLADIQSVKFYDASTGEYTDYTTEAKNATENDVPLDGDVGDYYLFGMSTAYYIASNGFGFFFTLPEQLNDYEYILEYYDNGAWHEVGDTYSWDITENFTKSGRLFVGVPYNQDSAVFDGTTARWIRARIVSKGTATPKAHTIQTCRCSGASNWQLLEKYSIDLKVLDEDGEPIEEATVVATDENGDEIFSTTTDENGEIETQYVIAKRFYFDPSQDGLISEDIYSTFSLVIAKGGHEIYNAEGLSVAEKLDLTISLQDIDIIEQMNIGVECDSEKNIDVAIPNHNFGISIPNHNIGITKEENNVGVQVDDDINVAVAV